GPSHVRDAFALPFDWQATPTAFFDETSAKVGMSVLQVLNTRSALLGATRVIDEISLDKYTFVRDAYLQRRRSLVYDGNVPETPSPPEDAASAPAGGASSPGAAAE